MAIHVINEAKRCLQCKKPMCQSVGCPVGTRIPDMIRMFLNGQINDAGEMLFANNPLSVICSLVCNQESQCEGHCIQGLKGSAVQISNIEHYISDAYLDRICVDREPDKGQRVAVIGSGPAGLTVAVKLAQKGYEVTIFERKARLGGMLRYGIPEFRLPKRILDRYLKKLYDLGIFFRPNTTIGGALVLDRLFDDGYDAVFMGTGTWRAKGLSVPGESLGNCHYAVDYLQSPSSYFLGNRIAVLGAGNSAMDAARTMIRHGASEVTIYLRSDKVRASEREREYAEADGVSLVYCMGVHSITKEGPMLYKRHFDENGVCIKEDPPQLYPADSTIIAVSQIAKDKIIRSTTGVTFNKQGLVDVDEWGRTKREGVYSAGDVVLGPNNVVSAVRDAKKAAIAMDAYLTQKRAR